MKILWLTPLNASKNDSSITPRSFMLSEKNEIARSIRKIGHEITGVICYSHKKGHLDGFTNIKYFKIRRPKWLFIALYHLRMLTSIISNDFDVILFGVHASHLIPIIKMRSYLSSLKPLLVLDIRTVPVDLSNNIRSKLEIIRYNAAVKIADIFCDGITCITPMLGSTLEPKLKKLKKNIGYFETGVNFGLFDPLKSVSLRGALGLKNRFIVFYHGDLTPKRGIQNAIKAIDLCKQRISNILFMVVGTGDGESELKKITKELELEKNILFTGGIPFEKVPGYIKTADVGIIPLPAIDGWNVSSPIKLKEYLAMQLPIIATDIPAHRFVIEKTGGAILIRNHNPQEIAQAIIAFHKNRNTSYPAKTRAELYDRISFYSQANKFIEYVDSLNSSF